MLPLLCGGRFEGLRHVGSDISYVVGRQRFHGRHQSLAVLHGIPELFRHIIAPELRSPKLAGGGLSVAAFGPFPFPFGPWHNTQLSRKRVFPRLASPAGACAGEAAATTPAGARTTLTTPIRISRHIGRTNRFIYLLCNYWDTRKRTTRSPPHKKEEANRHLLLALSIILPFPASPRSPSREGRVSKQPQQSQATIDPICE